MAVFYVVMFWFFVVVELVVAQIIACADMSCAIVSYLNIPNKWRLFLLLTARSHLPRVVTKIKENREVKNIEIGRGLFDSIVNLFAETSRSVMQARPLLQDLARPR